MQEKDMLLDLMKSMLGYIMKENELLKKENKELMIKQAKREAEDNLFKEVAQNFTSKLKNGSIKDLLHELPFDDDDGDGEAGA